MPSAAGQDSHPRCSLLFEFDAQAAISSCTLEEPREAAPVVGTDCTASREEVGRRASGVRSRPHPASANRARRAAGSATFAHVDHLMRAFGCSARLENRRSSSCRSFGPQRLRNLLVGPLPAATLFPLETPSSQAPHPASANRARRAAGSATFAHVDHLMRAFGCGRPSPCRHPLSPRNPVDRYRMESGAHAKPC
jgi:hypothetical protein